jgi:hypothetical protein
MASDLSVDYAALQRLSWETYQRELPTLLEERPGEWVAYRGDQRLGFGTTKTKLYQHWFSQGMTIDELFIACIEPYVGEYEMGVELVEPSEYEDLDDGSGAAS